MDAVFDPVNFKNEIIWRRTGSHNSSKRFGPIHDIVFFYWKNSGAFFKQVHRPYLKGHVDSYFKSTDERGRYWTNALTGAGTRNGASGAPWRNYNPTSVGRHWAIPGKIITFLGIDEDLTPQEKLDALDTFGFIDHPGEGSKAIPTYRQYLEKSPGSPIPDLWIYQPHTHGCLYGTEECIDEDVRWLAAQGDNERLGYPTQKPVGLLERIITASSKEGDIVLDPFCGCGTTIAAAQKLNRKWIGIDITHLSVALMKHRLHDMFGDNVQYKVVGEPVSLPDAKALAEYDPYQFQWWALGLVGARPIEEKRGADRGIDGRLYFHDETDSKKRKTKQIMLSVKSGNVGVKDVRDLRGVVEREEAQIGVLICMEKPTRNMRRESASAGVYKSPWGSHPRLQIITIEELLTGYKIDYPPAGQVNITFRKAPRVKNATTVTQPYLFGKSKD
jgi:site-specific DNA-methyltransferase (adenine-specific)